jgi:hypothetical protein
MSRHTHLIEKDGKEYIVAVGFDFMLGEYFIQVFDNTLPEEEELVLWEGTRMTKMRQEDMAYLFSDWGVKKEFISKLLMDEPF